MRRPKRWLAFDWYPIAATLGGLVFIGVLLWFQLGSLLPGLSEAEVAQTNAVTSLHDIRQNPLNFPHKVLQLGFAQLDIGTPARLASTIIGGLVILCFCYILRSWYSRRVALLGTMLFICSAWFLHTARLGTDTIMYALLIAPLTATVWLQKPRSGKLAVIAAVLAFVTLLYIPGVVWFVVPLALWQAGRLTRFIQGQHPALLTALMFLSVGLLTPLGLALYQNPELLRPYFGLPAAFPEPLEILQNIVGVPAQVFLRGPDNPEFWLGRLSLLSWFSIMMFVIGVYAYWLKRKLDRTRIFIYVGAIGTILIALEGPVTIAILLPFVYLIVGGGIGFMMQQWFTVFPRNPVARTFGPALMSVAVLMAVYYNINHYFIAWPNTPETRAVFDKSLQE